MKLSHVTFANELHQASFASFLQADLPPEEREDSGLNAALRERLAISNDDGTMAFSFCEYHLYPPAHSPEECRLCGLTYSTMVRVVVRLLFWERDPDSGSLQITNIYEQELYLAALPLITEHGTFLIEGEERVVCHQLRPRPGVWFLPEGPNEDRFAAWLIPRRGAWLKLFFGADDILYASIDGRKRFPASLLLEALCCLEDELLEALPCLQKTLQRHPFTTPMDAAGKLFQHHHTQTPQDHYLAELRRRYRSDEETIQQAYQRVYADGESAGDRWVVDHYLHNLFTAPLCYDMSPAGRRQLDERLGLASPAQDPDEEQGDTSRTGPLERQDILATIGYLDSLRRGQKGFFCDHPDDLANQRLWSVGELLMEVFHEGLALMSQTTERRLNKADEYCMPHDLLSSRPLQSRIDGFFADRSQVQPLESLNPLAEIEHLRRVLIPALKDPKKKPDPRQLQGTHSSHRGQLGMWRDCLGESTDDNTRAIATSTSTSTSTLALGARVSPGGVLQNGIGEGQSERKEAGLLRSLMAGLVPFESEGEPALMCDAERCLLQAIPLVKSELPWLRTGLEAPVGGASRVAIKARRQGVVVWADWYRVLVAIDDPDVKEPKRRSRERLVVPKIDLYPLLENRLPHRRHQVSQVPIARVGARVQPGDILTDGTAIKAGCLALGRNVLVAFVPWGHPAAEDGIVASHRLCHHNVFTSQRFGEPASLEGAKHSTAISAEWEQGLQDQRLLVKCIHEKAAPLIAELCEGATFLVDFHFEARGEPCVIYKDSAFLSSTLDELPLAVWPSLIGSLSLDLDVADRLLQHVYELADVDYEMSRLHQSSEQRMQELEASSVGIRQSYSEPLRAGDILGSRCGDVARVTAIRKVEEMPTLADGTPVDLVFPVDLSPTQQMHRRYEAALGSAASKAGSHIELPAGHWTEAELLARHQELLTATDMALDAAASLLDPKTGEVWDDDIVAGVVYVMKLSEEEPAC